MACHSDEQWYTESATLASLELGEMGRAMVLEHMREVLAPMAPDI